MKAALQRFAWRMWRGEAGVSGRALGLVLMPAEGLWRLVTRLRNRRYERTGGVDVEGVDVLSVGNLAVGGTGKTPVAAWFVDVLVELGRRPALLLRGYGADEVQLHRSWSSDVPVLTGADRVQSARRARAAGADSAVLDDGFQHRRLARSLDVVLLAAEDPLPAPVLPRGPYREPPTALRRADVVIVTRRSDDPAAARSCADLLRARGLVEESATLAGLRLAVERVVSLKDFTDRREEGVDRPEEVTDGSGEAMDGPDEVAHVADVTEGAAADAPPESMGGQDRGSLVLTAVARPDAFGQDVERITGGPVEVHAFADHHDFTPSDALGARARAGRRPIFVTAKDAVKLVEHVDELGDVRVVTQRLAWDWGEEEVRGRVRALFHVATRSDR